MTKTPFTVTDHHGRTVAVKSRKDLAIKFAIAQDADAVTNPKGEVVWTNPAALAATTGAKASGTKKSSKKATEAKVEKRQYKFATRRNNQPETAVTGRFELLQYGPGSETKYAERPDATLRLELGIKWRELWALGYTQKKCTEALRAVEKGETTIATLRAEALEALDLMDPADI
jgi:hypothetical protein